MKDKHPSSYTIALAPSIIIFVGFLLFFVWLVFWFSETYLEVLSVYY